MRCWRSCSCTKDTAKIPGANLPNALGPIGFDAGKRLIMASTENVFSLAPPYQGPYELQFQLTRGSRLASRCSRTCGTARLSDALLMRVLNGMTHLDK